MPGFDRSKLKATAISQLQKQNDEYEQKRPSGGGDRNYLEIKPGDNKFRIFPYHPDGGGSTYGESKCVSFLEVKTQKRDDKGKLIEGAIELKRRPIFNSKVHGNLPKDLVEEYMGFVKNKAIPEFVQDDSKRGEEIWKFVTGMQGVKPSDTFVMYASKWSGGTNGSWGPVGLLEVKKSIKNQLIELAIELASQDTATPDPYSDANEGIAIVINKSGEKLETEYKVSLDKVQKDKFNTQLIPTPLTDEQLEAWIKLDPLYKIYVNSYKRSDFNLQLEGLQNFEAQLIKKGYNLNTFAYDEWLDIVQEIDSMIPEENEKEEAKEEKASNEGLPWEEEERQEKPTVVAPKRTLGVVGTKVTSAPKNVVPSAAVEQAPQPRLTMEQIKAKYAKKK